LAVEYARAGFCVVGVDVDDKKVGMVNDGRSYIRDVSEAEIKSLVEEKRLSASCSFDVLNEADILSICVPTPLNKTKNPDVSFILSASEEIRRRLRRGQLVILESTTYPGTTEELIRPKLEESGLKAGTDFYLAFSPERIDPGNKEYFIRNTPKVVGGITANCLRFSQMFYEQVVDQVVPVSSTRTAEMVKLLENTFRSVNIGLVNEVALMCDVLDIDVWEVIEASTSKPFGFMRFYPGPGLGGHCIPVDPHYLSWKLKSLNYYARFIELAGEINANMPHFVIEKITRGLNARRKSINGSKILLLGISYKKDIDDVRESPALDVIRLLQQKKGIVLYNDPFVGEIKLDDQVMESRKLTASLLSSVDCVTITTDHSVYDYAMIVKHSPFVVDTRNATSGVKGYNDKIIRL
ncbi:MAG: UDP-N-acetyl-D-glucosamine dehydrogenase, partial [Candidatus Glassbacteria bacterium RBG_16_58_8]